MNPPTAWSQFADYAAHARSVLGDCKHVSQSVAPEPSVTPLNTVICPPFGNVSLPVKLIVAFVAGRVVGDGEVRDRREYAFASSS